MLVNPRRQLDPVEGDWTGTGLVRSMCSGNVLLERFGDDVVPGELAEALRFLNCEAVSLAGRYDELASREASSGATAS